MNDIEVSSIDLVEGGNVFKQGHYLTLGYVPRDENGSAVDLSGKIITVALWERDGIAFESAATYSGGVLRFTLNETVPAGNYQIEFTATSSADVKYRKKFPTNYNSGRISVQQSADDAGNLGISVYTVAQIKSEQQAAQVAYQEVIDPKITTLTKRVDDGVGAFTENTEIIDARMGKANLRQFNEGLTAQLAETENKNPIYITDNGAVDGQDSTQALLTSINEGLLQKRPIIVPHGTFIINSNSLNNITIPTGQWLVIKGMGQNSTLKRKDNSVTADNQKMMSVISDGIGHAAGFVLSDISINDNAVNNPIPDGESIYKFEHCPILAISGKSIESKIQNVLIKNIVIDDCVADGVWVNGGFIQSMAVDNMITPSRNRSRADIQISNGLNHLLITNSKLQNFEMEWVSDFSEDVMNIEMSNVVFGKGIDIIARYNQCKLSLNNVTTPLKTIRNCVGKITNSSLYFIAGMLGDLRWNKDIQFINCDFYLGLTDNGNDTFTVESVSLLESSGSYKPTKYRFKNCNFFIDSNQKKNIIGAAVKGSVIPLEHTDSIVKEFENCWFEDGFEHSIRTERGGTYLFKGNDYSGTDAGLHIWGSSTLPIKIIVDGGDFSRATKSFHIVGSEAYLTTKNITLDEVDAIFSFAAGTNLDSVVYNDRTVLVESNPPIYGIRGDKARLKIPVAGQPYEWVAMDSKPANVVWKVSKTLET